uniref:Uncharacterized protein n=1 Tax=viral metagenome TaxID=1070528 RepID=A0A6M3XPR1_9ZZZZ
MAKVKETTDIYTMDVSDLDSFASENRTKLSGEFCPRRDPAHDGRCFACEYIQREIYDKKYHDDHPARKWAADKKAKQNMFFNVVFKANPNKLIILEVGSKAGNIIWEGARNKGWTDITHPAAGKGREMTISKYKGDGKWPNYNAMPELNKADWDIPTSVLDNLCDLSRISDMIQAGELTDDNFMRVSSIKVGETLKFRICPPWNAKENKRWIGSTFRHWGISLDHINGDTPLDWKESLKDDTDKGTTLELPTKQKEDLPFVPDEPTKTTTTAATQQRPACYGDSRFMNFPADLDCSPPECMFGESCRQAVKAKMKE